ncbi:uncharacterized protein MELLADRAFT_102760 [Melampsora larici-populina 98AG31]|uniref:Uncharacterized protein n=1 Tax=Melampsora larici-populina (strain 98AG31 / pathotype 3-4-7) TaxID=747676 RepID=F4R9A4_MELLP|nr:uncharacterized protein MELLADRAFT_102760 [Melampsora larici-populina 98AG31]EGG10951.1 hypothetical protein MELLADRAFT_102760 [Melampsora larici-populina 98AG31]
MYAHYICQPDNRTEKISEGRFLKCVISLACDGIDAMKPRTLAPMPLLKRSLAWLLAELFDGEQSQVGGKQDIYTWRDTAEMWVICAVITALNFEDSVIEALLQQCKTGDVAEFETFEIAISPCFTAIFAREVGAIVLTILCASVISIAAYPGLGRYMPPSDPDDYLEIAKYATQKKPQEPIPKPPSSNRPQVNTNFRVKLVNHIPSMKSSEVTPASEIIKPRPMYK